MMSNTKVYVGDIGTVVTLDCGTDISALSSATIEVRKPNNASASWPASLSGTDFITYTAVSGDFNQAGAYRLQARVAIGAGVWRGETIVLQVYQNFA